MPATVSDIFGIRYGHSLELNALAIATAQDGVAFVSRQRGNNGISAYVAPIEGVDPGSSGEVTCALSGNGVLTTCLQAAAFYTGFHVAILRPEPFLTTQMILFYCLCIKLNRFRYSYGRQANKTLSTMIVPAVDEIPAWVNGVNLNQLKGASGAFAPSHSISIAPANWPEFRYDALFEIKKGSRLTKNDMDDGETPFVGAIDSNNGHRQYISSEPNHPGGTITVAYNGNGVAEAFYQDAPFRATDDVNVLYPKFAMGLHSALFICALIRQEKYRFNYGRKWHLGRMKEAVMRLPADASGDPDWTLIERYIKSLPYSKTI